MLTTLNKMTFLRDSKCAVRTVLLDVQYLVAISVHTRSLRASVAKRPTVGRATVVRAVVTNGSSKGSTTAALMFDFRTDHTPCVVRVCVQLWVWRRQGRPPFWSMGEISTKSLTLR